MHGDFVFPHYYLLITYDHIPLSIGQSALCTILVEIVSLNDSKLNRLFEGCHNPLSPSEGERVQSTMLAVMKQFHFHEELVIEELRLPQCPYKFRAESHCHCPSGNYTA
jgi:hypothetical protein